MEFKIIRTYSDDNCVSSPFSITMCDSHGNRKNIHYNVHLLRMNYSDHKTIPYLCNLNNKDNLDNCTNAIISKICYAPNNHVKGYWGVIASTISSLDLPSIDKSILDLVQDTNSFNFKESACKFCHIRNKYYNNHLYDGFTQEEFSDRNPCTFFDAIPLYKTASLDIKFFWKNNALFILRKYNNKIYEGYQWPNLSEEEKQEMLSRSL